MDISKLIEAAKVEGGEQAFGEIVQGEVQAAVTAAVRKISAEKAAAEESVARLEANNAALLDEWKPFQKAIKAAGVATNADGVADLEKRLQGKGSEPGEDAMAVARKLAGPMAEEATKSYEEKIKGLQEDLRVRDARTEAAIRRADRKHLEMLVSEHTSGVDADGKPRPALISSFRQHFIDTKVAPFVKFEDQDSGLGDGQTQRVPVVRHGEVPIMAGATQADVGGLIRLAHDGKGDAPWNTGTRDFFASSGSGGDAGRNSRGGPTIPVDARNLGKTQSLAEYREQRKKVAS